MLPYFSENNTSIYPNTYSCGKKDTNLYNISTMDKGSFERAKPILNILLVFWTDTMYVKKV